MRNPKYARKEAPHSRALLPEGYGQREAPAETTANYMRDVAVAQHRSIPLRSKATNYDNIPAIFRGAGRNSQDTFRDLNPREVGPKPGAAPGKP